MAVNCTLTSNTDASLLTPYNHLPNSSTPDTGHRGHKFSGATMNEINSPIVILENMRPQSSFEAMSSPRIFIEDPSQAILRVAACLASPKPLRINEVQKPLGPDEVLVLLLDTPKCFSGSKLITPAETFVWAITREQAIWNRAPLGGKALADKVARLRCGLDGSNWAAPAGWPDKQQWDIDAKAAQQKKRDKCISLIGATYTDRDWPPFPFDTAFELYQTLLGPVEQIFKGKKLLVAASGSLTGLPLQILLTSKTQSKGWAALPVSER